MCDRHLKKKNENDDRTFHQREHIAEKKLM